jgi:HEAT repeat protein
MNDTNDLPPRPPQYTPDEWAEYHRDPCGWCIKELRNPDPSVRCAAADTLRGLAWDAEAAIPALIVGFDDPDPTVRPYCVHALVDIGYAVKDRASAAVPALTTLLRDGDLEIRCLAAHALGAIGRAAASATGELRKRLSDPDEETREAAASALKAIEEQS